MTRDYQPIACDLHSQFELAAMRGQRLELTVTDPSERCTGLACDLIVRDRAEWLVLADDDGRRREIRLDKIADARVLTGLGD